MNKTKLCYDFFNGHILLYIPKYESLHKVQLWKQFSTLCVYAIKMFVVPNIVSTCYKCVTFNGHEHYDHTACCTGAILCGNARWTGSGRSFGTEIPRPLSVHGLVNSCASTNKRYSDTERSRKIRNSTWLKFKRLTIDLDCLMKLERHRS